MTMKLGPYICAGVIDCGALMDRALSDARASIARSRNDALLMLTEIKAAHADWLEGHGLTGRKLRQAGTPFSAAYAELERWLKETAPSKRPRAKSGFVYVIGMEGDNSVVKIGFATKVDDRRSTLQTSSHRELTVLLSIKGTRDKEKELHRRFAADHIRGEWFHRTRAVEDFIVANTQQRSPQ